MKFVKILLGIIVALVVLFVAGGMLLPSEQHVERSIIIEAEPGRVFSMVNDYRQFNEWSPWATYDPEGTTYEYGGPATGVGSKMSWSSEHPNVGSGMQEIVGSEPNTMVKSKLLFEGFETPSYATFTLEPAEGGTRLTWSFDTDMENLIGRYMGLMMDEWVGGDYERGLARLKELLETEAAAS